MHSHDISNFVRRCTNALSHYRRFDASYREHIWDLAVQSDPICDLLESFPALIFALASKSGRAAQRRKALSQIEQGAPLADIAKTLCLPVWMKKIPPEALRAALPPLATSAWFNRRIVNFIPPEPELCAIWLEKMIIALQLCDERFALWVAQRAEFHQNLANANEPLQLLAAWAWFSRAEGTLGHKLLRKPWHEQIGLEKAFEEAKIWFNRMQLYLHYGEAGYMDSWLAGGEVLGYEFTPLLTADDFFREAFLMRNCLDQFNENIRHDGARVFRITRGGRTVAVIEIASHNDEHTMPSIVQLRGPQNKRVSPQIWQAAYAWLGSQELQPKCDDFCKVKPVEETRRIKIWGSYLLALAGKMIAPELLTLTDPAWADEMSLRLESYDMETESYNLMQEQMA